MLKKWRFSAPESLVFESSSGTISSQVEEMVKTADISAFL
jgi:hypothetical protein